ncbi:hypothetical protein E9229_000332 [Paeniglutamicibacter cryotolerans]|uniref:Uncharacterized protein n=1 Tax=Paeniglutamicibacter cryotolerans TaxID=670079 RepID=A0A839QPX8_9MICC|nr:hypothetical protein [Paeniglutamicibacter cryotolerans]
MAALMLLLSMGVVRHVSAGGCPGGSVFREWPLPIWDPGISEGPRRGLLSRPSYLPAPAALGVQWLNVTEGKRNHCPSVHR